MDTLIKAPTTAVAAGLSRRQLEVERLLAGDRIRLAYSALARRRGRRGTVGGRRLS